MAHQIKNPSSRHEDAGLIPGLIQWVKDPPQAGVYSQMQPRSGVAVAAVVASSCSSNSTPSWELPYATGAALKKGKKKLSSLICEKISNYFPASKFIVFYFSL